MLTTAPSSITFNWKGTNVAEVPKDANCVLAHSSIYSLMSERHRNGKLYCFAVAIDGTVKPFFADGANFAKYLVVHGKQESPLTRLPFIKGAFFAVKANESEAHLLCTLDEFTKNIDGIQHFIAASDDDLDAEQRIRSTRAIALRSLSLIQHESSPTIDTLYWMEQGASQKDVYCASWLGQHYMNTKPAKAVEHFEHVLADQNIPLELQTFVLQLMPKALKQHPDPYSHTNEFLKHYWSRLKQEDLIRLQSIVEKHETRKQSNSFLNLPDIPLTEDLLISHTLDYPDNYALISSLGDLVLNEDTIEKR